MKMKKIIPLLALSMLFTVPAFAADPTPGEVQPTEMNTPLDFVIGDFFKIHRGTEVYHANAQLTANNYTTLNLDKALKAEYVVYTNIPTTGGEHVTLKGVVDSAGSDKDALYGTDEDDLWLIFGNTTNKPSDASIAACRTATDSTGQNNPNAIVLQLTPTVTKTAGSGSTNDSDVVADYTGTANRVKYSFSNGIYTFRYITAQEAKANTFSTADTAGTYKATLYITRNGA